MGSELLLLLYGGGGRKGNYKPVTKCFKISLRRRPERVPVELDGGEGEKVSCQNEKLPQIQLDLRQPSLSKKERQFSKHEDWRFIIKRSKIMI